ncbi:MAG: Inosine-5'-monophosphate dehydrogenase [Mycoplasmataceae bacterium]|nr:MAG: Inosine-5'-monophosphate dehydrogenase [Mycoplasmataceae bacterium]
MWRRKLISFVIALLLNSFLGFLGLIYSNVDLFKIDLVETRKRDKEGMSKLYLILKNNYLLTISICIIQTFLGLFISETFSGENLGNFRNLNLIFLSFFIMIFTEIFPNYFAGKEFSKLLTLHPIFLNSAYLITSIFSPLKIIIKERKKFFTHSESDIIRFINNLTTNEILLLEPKEAQLVKLAFKLDDDDVRSVLIPIESVVHLKTSMSLDDIKNIYLDKNLSKYLVFEKENNKLLGVLNVKSLFFSLLNNKSVDWKNYINKNVIFFNENTKLNNALETLKNSRNHLSVIKNDNNEILGIVTLKDILGSLVGKIHDEKS